MEVYGCKCSDGTGGLTRCAPKYQKHSPIFFLEMYDLLIFSGFIIAVVSGMSLSIIDGIKKVVSSEDQSDLNTSTNVSIAFLIIGIALSLVGGISYLYHFVVRK
jgi:hypothetical protein